MRQLFAAVVGFALIVGSAAPVSALGIGDRAPALSIEEWVQGHPVDLAREIGTRVFMVEFWATWCPPCKASVPRLTEFQNKYKKDLTIIGITSKDDRGNTNAAVRRFVKDKGPKMSYTVAMDKDMVTSMAYMGGAEVAGIPYAFLVARNGKIAWEGSPLDPALDDVLSELISGTFNFDAAAVAAQVDQRFQALDPLFRLGHFSAAWDGLIGILKLDPANDVALQLLLAVHLEGHKDAATYRSWARAHIKEYRKNGKAMAQLATILADNADLATRYPDLALEAARAAYDAPGKRTSKVLAVYARALYQIGKLDRAIELQTEAVASAKDPVKAQAVLDYYALCKKLQKDY